MTYFISFSGKKQTGKDASTAIAKKLLEANGKSVTVTAFAEPLKRMCIDILGLDEALVYGSNEDKDTLTHIGWDTFPQSIREKYSLKTETHHPDTYLDHLKSRTVKIPRSGAMTVREVLQVVGTDIFREMFFDTVWADAPFRKPYKDADVVILTDCRFPNEKDATEGNGGVVIRLERSTGLTDNHRSEVALDGYSFEYFYENNGTVQQLEEFIANTLTKLGLL